MHFDVDLMPLDSLPSPYHDVQWMVARLLDCRPTVFRAGRGVQGCLRFRGDGREGRILEGPMEPLPCQT